MQYLDDIFELIEDLPEEITNRFDRIRKLDRESKDVMEDFKRLRKLLLDKTQRHPPHVLQDTYKKIGQKYARLREIAEEKIALSERTERFLLKVSDKVGESTYHCKIELEVDNPGYTEMVERNFCASQRVRPSSSHMNNCQMQFEPIDGPGPVLADFDFGLNSRLTGRPLKEQNKYRNRDRSISGTPPPSRKNNARKGKNDNVKRKRDKGANKMISSRGRNRDDFAAFSLLNEDGMSSRASSTKGDDDYHDLFGTNVDPLDSEEDLNNLDITKIFPVPQEDLDALMKDESLGFLSTDELLGNLNDFGPSSAPDARDSPGRCSAGNDLHFPPHATSSSLSRQMREASVSSVTSSSHERSERKKKQHGGPTFTHTAEALSMHGRPRKLTNRMEEMIHMSERKEKERKKKDEDVPVVAAADEDLENSEESDDHAWCLCQKPSSGDMICCDNESCHIQWFHFACIGLTESPAGVWYCPNCRAPANDSVKRKNK